MSVSLVVIRLETADDGPKLKHLEYQARKCNYSKSGKDLGINTSEWPLLVTDRLLSIHRGQRIPREISITTLEEEFINQEMASFGVVDTDECDFKPSDARGASEKFDLVSGLRCGLTQSSKESTPGPSSSKEGTPGPSDEGTGRRGIRGPPKEHVQFIAGNPMVEVTKGILHLYKENTKTSLEEDVPRSEMLCMFAVPSSMTVRDLLQFTAPCNPEIQHLRIIRDSTPNQYMVLLKFRDQASADFFYKTFNEQPYNSIEPDICHLVYVAKVETTSESENGGLPIPGLTELPTCPVCLERMDESVDGILTILCNHSFHGECLAKWGDTSCPVCRCCQTPNSTPDQCCLLCGSTSSLWICLICGHVGCGRYVDGHAHRHFMETDHLFSLEVGSNRVWDYVRDNYVHRLLQSEGDGKMVSFERASPVADYKEDEVQGEEKLTGLQLEFTHLLTSQLESQRHYYESKLEEIQASAITQAEENQKLAEEKTNEAKNLRDEVASLLKEKQTHERKLGQYTQKLCKLSKELETEQQLNMALLEGKNELSIKLQDLEKQIIEKDQVIVELEAEIRDIMLHLEAQSAVCNNPELQGGQVVIEKGSSKKPQGVRRKQKK